MSEIAPEILQARNAIETLIHYAPPGEIRTVVEDCELLLGSTQGVISFSFLEKVLRAYNENQHLFTALHDASGTLLGYGLISKSTCIENNLYASPHLQLKFGFDQLRRKAISVNSLPFDKYKKHLLWQQYSQKLETQLKSYIRRVYKTPAHLLLPNRGITVNKNATVLLPNSDDTNKLEIVIKSVIHNLNCFWTGSWLSKWNLEFVFHPSSQDVTASGPIPTAVKITGSVATQGHYFELGNSIFNQNKQFETPYLISLEGNFENHVASICGGIQLLENQVHTSFTDLLYNFDEGIFKHVRRILPVTAQPFDWTFDYKDLTDELKIVLDEIPQSLSQ